MSGISQIKMSSGLHGLSCLSGNGAKDVAEVLLTLKDKKWADKLDWHVAQ